MTRTDVSPRTQFQCTNVLFNGRFKSKQTVIFYNSILQKLDRNKFIVNKGKSCQSVLLFEQSLNFFALTQHNTKVPPPPSENFVLFVNTDESTKISSPNSSEPRDCLISLELQPIRKHRRPERFSCDCLSNVEKDNGSASPWSWLPGSQSGVHLNECLTLLHTPGSFIFLNTHEREHPGGLFCPSGRKESAPKSLYHHCPSCSINQGRREEDVERPEKGITYTVGCVHAVHRECSAQPKKFLHCDLPY